MNESNHIINVCFVCRSLVGGFKSFVENTIRVLQKKNCNIAILNLGSDPILFKNVAIISFNTNQKRTKPSLKERFFELWIMVKKCFKRIKKFLFHSKRRVCLEYNIFNSQFFAMKKVFRCGETIDLTSYDCVISAEEVFCNYFLSHNVKAKKKIGYVHPDYKMARFNKSIDGHFFKNLDVICAVSIANSISMKESLPVFKDRIIGVPNPICVDTISKRASEMILDTIDSGVFNLVTVCRLDNTSKALDRLLLIALRLKNEGLSFCWRIIGDGQYKEEMEMFIKKNNLSSCIMMLGHLDNPIVYVAKSDLFVLQSYYEGYPISVCESLVVNTPVLVTNFPSSKELVSDGVTGFVVDNNEDAIFRKLLAVLTDKKTSINNLKNNLIKIDKDYFERSDALFKALNL